MSSDAFPFHIPRLFLYAQLAGTTGEYTARVRFVRVTADEDGEEAEVPVTTFGPWPNAVTGGSFAESFGSPLRNAAIEEPGVYEFQLWLDEFDEPLGRERVQGRGRPMPTDPKPTRKPERFTMLEPKGPNHLTPERTG